jgi:hypothetical protein
MDNGAVDDEGETDVVAPLPSEEEDDHGPDNAIPERNRRIRSAWGGQRPQEHGGARAVGRPPPESEGPRFITSARRTLRTQGMNKPLSEAIAEGPDAVSDYWKRLMKRAEDESSSGSRRSAAVGESSQRP